VDFLFVFPCDKPNFVSCFHRTTIIYLALIFLSRSSERTFPINITLFIQSIFYKNTLSEQSESKGCSFSKKGLPQLHIAVQRVFWPEDLNTLFTFHSDESELVLSLWHCPAHTLRSAADGCYPFLFSFHRGEKGVRTFLIFRASAKEAIICKKRLGDYIRKSRFCQVDGPPFFL
jgi:hypothetical protein